MTSIQRRIGLLFAIAIAVAANADEQEPNHSLELSASTPQVEISGRLADRSYLRLPSLEYTFQVRSHCAGLFGVASVSLSIADSSNSVSAGKLDDDGTIREITIKVPAKQLAPVAIENFCVKQPDKPRPKDKGGANRPNNVKMKVSAALSAQAALLCTYEGEQQIVYTSNPLDINLICSAAEEVSE